MGQEQTDEIVASLGEIERKCEALMEKIDRWADQADAESEPGIELW